MEALNVGAGVDQWSDSIGDLGVVFPRQLAAEGARIRDRSLQPTFLAAFLAAFLATLLATFSDRLRPDRPDFVEDVLEMIHQWNLKRMELTLSAAVDLYIRRAWYEGVDFVVPAMDTLGPDGFILSPVDNITVDRPQTWRNVDIFIDEWKKHR